MVNKTPNNRGLAWIFPACAIALILTAWTRSAEYDEQYTLFLTAGVPRPDWPEAAFPAGLARTLQAGHAGLAAIARDLRNTDVHPPLYFWLVSLWRWGFGDGLFVARLFSVLCGLGSLALTSRIAWAAGISAARAILLTAGCYGFAYTNGIARGFALAQLLLMGGAAGLLMGRRTWHFAGAGMLLGAAVLTNYLSVFVAAPGLLAVWGEALLAIMARPVRRVHPEEPRMLQDAAAATIGFMVLLPASLWFFLAQRGSREGQFPPFETLTSLSRLAGRGAGAILGGLPLYVDGWRSPALAAALGALLIACGCRIAWCWSRSGKPRARRLFALAAAGPPLGLMVLGATFNNTPIELRYLSFSLPFLALLLAGALGTRMFALLITVQAASLAGLMLAPPTMQPGRAAARTAAALVADGIVIIPRGNDGVGVVGAFAIEAPPALPLLLVRGGELPGQIRARLTTWHRVVLALLEQDSASQSASAAMRAALSDPDWREVARHGDVAVYERTGGGDR